MIVVSLEGRIGNQLFIYAAAEALRQKRGRNEKIVICDQAVLEKGWVNSLLDYDLENVTYVHSNNERPLITKIQSFLQSRFFRLMGAQHDVQKRSRYERKMQSIFNALGIVESSYGYVPYSQPKTKNVLLKGYFQSEEFFADVVPLIREKYMNRLPILREKEYVQKLESRNSVCISIKVEHNAGDALYDVCSKDYYTQAIQYITEHVKNPLFFICSDNVQYVLEHYIDASKYDYICQEKGLPVSDSLAIMGACKHYVIGNTSFGWWAQFLSSNPEKIVVAPNRWYRDENMPVGVYSEKWHLIDVTGYIKKTSDQYENK